MKWVLEGGLEGIRRRKIKEVCTDDREFVECESGIVDSSWGCGLRAWWVEVVWCEIGWNW